MNLVILMGNVGKDPEVRMTASGKKLAKFTLAVRRPFSKDATDWFNCAAWEKTAETIEKFVKKGSKISVQGRVQVDSYEKDGVKQTRTGIVVENFEFAGAKPDDGTTAQAPAQQNASAQQAAPAQPVQKSAPAPTTAVTDDDIPF